MSLVMVSATSKYVILTGDGRVSDKVQTDEYSSSIKVLKEDFKKVRIIKDNILIGFTGHLKTCLDVLDSLNCIDIKQLGIDEITDFLISSARTKDNKNELCMVLCGINDKNKIQINAFTTDDNLNLNKCIVNSNEVKFISLTNDKSHEKPRKIFFEKVKDINICNKEEVLNLMANINHEISISDFTVNDNMNYFILEL